MTGPRPWDVRELDAGNVRRIDFRRGQPENVPDRPTPGKLHRLPCTPQTVDAIFRGSSTWTRQCVRALAHLGFDVEQINDESVTLTGVGKNGMTIVLYHDGEMPLEIARVAFGRERWTAREAALWFAQRKPR